jgi:hypothetical protein
MATGDRGAQAKEEDGRHMPCAHVHIPTLTPKAARNRADGLALADKGVPPDNCTP